MPGKESTNGVQLRQLLSSKTKRFAKKISKNQLLDSVF